MTTMHQQDLLTQLRAAATAYEKAFDRFFRRWTDLNLAKSRLDRWREVGFVNTDGADIPPRDGSEVIDARDWPDATEMAQLVKALRDAEDEYRSVWESLPAEIRQREPLRIN